MCNFASFVVRTNDCKVFMGDFLSHEGVEMAWGLKPDTYRECEWVGEEPEMLTVRGETSEEEEEIREGILRRYPSRCKLFAAARVGRKPGMQFWYREGYLHREDGPAVVKTDGSQEWWRDGKRHRDGAPAIIRPDGREEWWIDGKRHREDGPAIIRPDGREEWWTDGVLI